MITRPLLAADLYDKNGNLHLELINYPVLATPKLDGIRCLMVNGCAVSRTFKPIRNDYVRRTLETSVPDGVDGELIILDTQGKPLPFNQVSSAIMSQHGVPHFHYLAFDWVSESLSAPYSSRIKALATLKDSHIPDDWFTALLPTILYNESDLMTYETKCLVQGYEGICFRSVNSPYKCGRSTVREGYLIKLKRFKSAEAVVLGFEELMHNDNVQTLDSFGLAERSSHAANLRPSNMLGALIVCDLVSGAKFHIGTGFTADQRKEIWQQRDFYLGQYVSYKYQPHGSLIAPRSPVFMGFRHKEDM